MKHLVILFLLLLAVSPVLADNSSQMYLVQFEEPDVQRSVKLPQIITQNVVTSERNERLDMKDFEVLHLTESELADLRARGQVKAVQIMERVYTQLVESKNLTNTGALAHHRYSFDELNGTGESVCIIDTGIATDHENLPTNTIIAQQCYVDDLNLADTAGWCPNGQRTDNDANDDDGHGTFIAGIYSSNHSTYSGVALGSTIVSVKALAGAAAGPDNGSGLSTDIAKGIQFCVDNKDTYNISVISMSLGGLKGYDNVSDCESENYWYVAAINEAVEKNITVLIASGNCHAGDGLCSQGAQVNKISAPACIGNATSVGAVTEAGVMAYFSQRGPLLDFVAPGQSMTSLDHTGGLSTGSGTSYAAPFFGAVTLNVIQSLEAMYGREPTVDEVISALSFNTVEIDDTSESGYNYSMVRVFEAISINSPLQSNISTTFFNINYTINTSSSFFPQGTATCAVNVNGNNYSTINATTGNHTAVVTGISVDSNWTVQCSNTTASLSSRQGSVQVNVPKISFQGVNDSQLYLNPITSFNYAVQHTSNISSCNVSINNVSVGSQASLNLNTNYSINTTNYTGIINTTVTCIDVNNVTANESISFSVDPEPVNISILSPSNTSWVKDLVFTVQYNATDDVGVDWCATYVDGQVYDNRTGVNGSTILNVSKGSGNHTWFVSCADGLGSRVTNTTERIFRVDAQPPVTTFSGFDDGEITPDNVSITLNTVHYGPSQGYGPLYSINGSNYTNYTSAINLTSPGTYNISYYAYDEAGNNESIKKNRVTIQRSTPELTVTLPTNNSYSQNSIQFIASVDQPSDITIYIDNTEIQQFTNTTSVNEFLPPVQDSFQYEYRIVAENLVGFNDSVRGAITVDSQPPTLILPTYPNSANNTINLSGFAYDDNTEIRSLTFVDSNGEQRYTENINNATHHISFGNYTVNWTIPYEPVEGKNVFHYRIDDLATNVISSSYHEITKDTTVPTIHSIEPSNTEFASGARMLVKVVATDNLDQDLDVTAQFNAQTIQASRSALNNYVFDLNTSNMTPKLHSLNILAVDNYNNSVNASMAININNSLPSATPMIYNNTLVKNGSSFDIIINNASYANISTSTGYTANLSANNTLTITSGDKLVNVTIFLQGTTNRTQLFSFPVSSQISTMNVINNQTIYTTTNTTTITGTISNPERTREFSINGKPVQENSTFAFNYKLIEGTNLFYVRYWDIEAEAQLDIITVIKDTFEPDTAINFNVSPIRNWYQGPVFVNFTINDNGAYSSGTSPQIWNGSWTNVSNTTITKSQTLGYRSIDNAGNIDTSNKATQILIDTQNPQISVVTKSVYPTSSSIPIRVGATDNQSGIHSVQATLGGVTRTLSKGTKKYTTTFPAMQPGRHILTVTATDTSGRQNITTNNITIAKKQNVSLYTHYIANEPQRKNFSKDMSTIVDIALNTTTIANFTSSQFNSSPVNSPLGNATTFYKFELSTTDIEWIYPRMNYTKSDLPAFAESNLAMYWFNETSGNWMKLNTTMSFVNAVGQNKSEKYLWANVTHFSSYSYTGQGTQCENVLNSNNKTTQDCYFEGTFHNSGGYICSDGHSSEECYPQEESSSSSGGGAGGGAGESAPTVTMENTSQEDSQKTEKKSPQQIQETNVSNNTITEDANVNKTIENNTLTNNSNNQRNTIEPEQNEVWMIWFVAFIAFALLTASILNQRRKIKREIAEIKKREK